MKSKPSPKFPFNFVIVLIVLLLVLGVTPMGAKAQENGGTWLSFDASLSSQAPQVALLSADAYAIDLQASAAGVTVSKVTIGGIEYLFLDSEGYQRGSVIGAPDLPVLRQLVEVPLGAEVTVEILETTSQTVNLARLGLTNLVAPVQPSQPKCGEALEPCSPDQSFYGSVFPTELARITDDYIIRGHRLVEVEISPVRYNAAAGELETTSNVTVRLNLADSNLALTTSEADRLNSRAFNEMLAPTVLNYNQGRPVTINAAERLLIITVDSYEAGLADFVTLKQSQGFTVSVATVTQAGGNTTTAIKNYIKAQYTGATPPDYVILVGDYMSGDPVGSLTNYSMKTSSSKRTDLHYFTMDSDTEYVPDIFYGRFPVRTNANLAAMIDKYEAYHLVAGDEAWVKKATFLGSDDSNYGYIAERTHNYVIDTYTLPKGYTGIYPNNPQPGGDKVYQITYGLGGTEANAAMNDHRAFVVYSGHGATTFWDAPRVTQADVRNLTGVAIPYVASHACITADFNTGEAFSDTWVIEPVNGALTFFAASESTYWYEDEVLEKAIFDKLFYDPNLDDVPSVGVMTQYGLQAVENYGTSRDDYYREAYHIFGDPSLQIVLKPKFPDFRIAVSPQSLKTCNTGEHTATINLTTINEFASPITLSASTLQGYTTTFGTNPVNPPATTSATITGNGSAPTGTQNLVITGKSGSLTHTAEIEMTIYHPVTGAPGLKSPANGARDVLQRPTFSWTASPDAETYRLQVATDPNFTQIVVNRAGISGTSFTLANNLVTDTQYYWRVYAENVCGGVVSTQTFAFRTKPGPGDCAQGTVKQVLFFDDFEDGIAKWQNPGDPFKFDITTVRAYSPVQSVLAEVPASQTDQRLSSPSFAIPLTDQPVSLIFWHRWTFDHATDCNDGGILEVSLDGGTIWSQIAKPYLLTNPYNGTIKAGVYNPLVGKEAWCKNSGDWVRTVVDLTPFKGKTVQFRFRLGTGTVGQAEGWFIDDVAVQTCIEGVFPEYSIFLPSILR